MYVSVSRLGTDTEAEQRHIIRGNWLVLPLLFFFLSSAAFSHCEFQWYKCCDIPSSTSDWDWTAFGFSVDRISYSHYRVLRTLFRTIP